MKKLLLFLCLFGLVGCSSSGSVEVEQRMLVAELPPLTEVTLAMYPVGNLGSISAFSAVVSGFNNSQDRVKVSVEYLTYADGDAVIEERMNSKDRFNMVFEGPERLVSNWGRRELMVPLNDIWDSYTGEVSENVRKACKEGDTYYEYPICMTAHMMAVNKDVFEEAGLLSEIDADTRAWSTESFIKAVEVLKDDYPDGALSVYCTSQGGDQGTRMLVNNLYGGKFTNTEHNTYLVNSQENTKALWLLQGMDGVVFNAEEDGALNLDAFCKGKYPMTACWNVGQEIAHANLGDVKFDIYPVCYPTEDGSPAELCSGVWGFGVFDTGVEKTEACKEFIKYIADNKEVYKKVVTLSTFWPTLELEDIYVNDSVMNEYGLFTDYVGDYYQVADNWTEARAAWWKMLQEIGESNNVDECVAKFQQEVEK